MDTNDSVPAFINDRKEPCTSDWKGFIRLKHCSYNRRHNIFLPYFFFPDPSRCGMNSPIVRCNPIASKDIFNRRLSSSTGYARVSS